MRIKRPAFVIAKKFATVAAIFVFAWSSISLVQAVEEPCQLDGVKPLDLAELQYEKLTPSSAEWFGSTFWSGPDWTRVGKDWQHPGQDTPSVRCLTLPKDGKVTITGCVSKADTKNGGGDGVRAMIRHGEREVWKAEINGDDSKGISHEVTLDVRQGEVLRFVIDKRGKIFFDTTYWDPVITYADGTRFQASADFSTERTDGVWSYEMDASENARQAKIDQLGLQTLLTILSSKAARQLQKDPALADQPDATLWKMVQEEWRREDQLRENTASYRAATTKHLEKARQLLADLQNNEEPGFLQAESQQLDSWAQDFEQLPAENANDTDLQAYRNAYYRVRWLKRHIALSNPLMDFGEMLFTKRVPSSYSHLVMQYFGWRARPGGGLFVLEKPGHSLQCHDILDGKLSKGNVLEPRLSYDAKRIVFSFVDNADKEYNEKTVKNDCKDEGFYHIFEVNIDGTGLKQLTAGPFDDLMPTYLPDGGIAFCSTRRLGYARCFGSRFSERWHIYTLHRMDGDGENLRTLSVHDTNEWFPAVDHSGRLIYSRWDYIDRDAVTHQNLWATRPDGTNPVAVWGNAAPSPHCTFQPQPIPDSKKVVFTASAHHSITGGSIVVLDPTVDNNSQDALQRITPEVPFPEAETRKIDEYYAAPWPLSEKYFLTAYSHLPLVWEPYPNPANALGIYLLDAFGNRELIYRDPAIGCTNPCPLQQRQSPPVLASTLPDEWPEDTPPMGEVVVSNVYEGLGDVPRGEIKQLRIVQIFPKTTPYADSPPVGIAREENARAILGTVPVEPDGSASFRVPAMTPILFQALDEEGMAYQTMRSLTYLQPGERVSCIGCHEDAQDSPGSYSAPAQNLMALRRSPSTLEPGQFGGEPFSYMRVVQPVWDKHCVSCHAGDKADGGVDLTSTPDRAFNRSYYALCGDSKDFFGTATNPENASTALVPRFGRRNQIQITKPGGIIGARGSRLIKLLREGHYDVNLSPEELRRIATWIDMNAVFYGANKPEDQARQLRGEKLPMPAIQ